MRDISLKKYLLINSVGFGIAGLLWGWLLYEDRFFDSSSPFHYLSIFIVGILGGVSLSIASRDWKVVLKSVGAMVISQCIIYIFIVITYYYFTLIGVFILGFLPISAQSIQYLELEPKIGITAYWLSFASIGIITGLIFALFFKKKIWPVVWRVMVGLIAMSLVGPVLGNYMGDLFDSLLISYLITFVILCWGLGLPLAYGIYKFTKRDVQTTR